MKRQIRVSDKHFKELDSIAADLGMKKSEILGFSLGILRAIRNNNAKSLKILTADGKEIEILLPVDLTNG